MNFITLLKYIFLGFVQGFTEPIPVSSSGHLFIFKTLLNDNVLNDLNLNYKIENMDIKNPKNEKGNDKNYVDCIMTFKVI